MASGRRVAGLDILRGCAIILVFLRHAWPAVFQTAGIVGVILFFTLSGYLITGILDRELTQTGTLSFRRFYRNRALRLGPALVVVLVVFAVVESLTNRLYDQSMIAGSIGLAITYTADLPIGHMSPGLSPLWTLAVEEQFYVIWPVCMMILVRRRLLARVLPFMLVGMWLVAAASTVVVHTHRIVLYQLPTSWALALLISVAAYTYRESFARVLSGRTGGALAATQVCVLAVLCVTPSSKVQSALYLAICPAVALGGAVLIFRLAECGDGSVRIMRPIQAIGRISYATYLWNYLIVLWISHGTGRLSLLQGVASIALTLAAAIVSWCAVEAPASRWKTALTHKPATVLPPLAAAAHAEIA